VTVRRLLRNLIPLYVFIALVVLGVFVVTSTDWGRNFVRGRFEALLQNNSHGIVHIGSVTGNLRHGFTLHDLVITDSAHKPFVNAKEVWAKYSLSTFFGKKIEMDSVKLVHPVIVLDRMPGGKWNYDRIFPRDTVTKQGVKKTGWGTWIRFTNVTIIDGDLTVNSPWAPNDTLSPAKKAAAIKRAFTDDMRFDIKRVQGGFQKTAYYHNINAFLPLLRLEDPAYAYRRAVVARGNALAVPFKPPTVTIKDVNGIFDFNSDSVWFRGVKAVLPGTNVNGDGMYSVDNGDMWLRLHAPKVAAADLRWIHPPIPESGSGKMDFALNWKNGVEYYQATNADLTLNNSHMWGDFGITFVADTFALHKTDMHATNLDTHLIQRILPWAIPPRHGILSGRMKAAGGQHALAMDGDITFRDPRSGVNRVIGVGEVGFFPKSVTTKNLRLRLVPLQVALLKQWMPTLPIGGTLTGPVTLNGNTDGLMRAQGDVTHVDRTGRSNVEGRAAFRMAGTPWFDVDARLRPLSLATVGQFVPKAGLRGSASGPFRLVGSLRDFAVNADLGFSDGGSLNVHGRLDLASRAKGYDLTANAKLFNANAIISKAPRTSITAFASAKGRGTDPATMTSTIVADVSASSYDTLSVEGAQIRVRVANGMANVDTATVKLKEGVATAAGTFGLKAGTSGELRYHVAIDSLAKFAGWIPGPDTGSTQPRPGILARRIAKAKADSAALDKKTEVERAVTGRTLPPVVVDTPTVVPNNVLSGTIRADGVARGNIKNFGLKGTASGHEIVARGNTVQSFTADYEWLNATTPMSSVKVNAIASNVVAGGFQMDSVTAKIGYQKPRGTAELTIRQDDKRNYAVNADYLLNKDRNEVRLNNLALQFDTTLWKSTQPSTIHWGTAGVDVEHLELRNAANGRIFLDGLIPKQGPASFQLAVDNFNVGDAISLLESDIPASGFVSLDMKASGTAADPTFSGSFGTQDFVYSGTKIPELHGTVSYANQTLTGKAELMEAGVHQHPELATIEGTIPINLALTGVTGSRFPTNREMALNVKADSLPLDLIPSFNDIITNVSGKTIANMKVGGTLNKPRVTGEFKLANGSARFVPAGINIKQINASIRLLSDTVVIDSITGNSSGRMSVRGGLGIADLKNPTFDLRLVTENARVLDNQLGDIRAISNLNIVGPFGNAYVTGAVRLRDGVIYIPEAKKSNVIGRDDPALFNVLDTAVASNREIFPTQSPLLANLRMDVALRIDRDVFVRNRDANIEIYSDGDLLVSVNRAKESLLFDGIILSERGEYNFLTKRFQIKRGSATFMNTQEINPALQGTAEYEVRLPAREAIRIRIVLGGTMQSPTIALESDAQPPIPQSDLLAYLAFGKPSSSLLQLEGSGVSTGGTSGGLVGTSAALATKQLAAVAIGVAADEFAGEAAQSLGADVFNITPADVQSDVGSFLRATEIEFGKYIKTHTFVSVQGRPDPEALKRPGLRLEHRFGGTRGYRLETSFEPRFLLKEPTLAPRDPSTTSVLGLFLIREWRF
jgi:translocation and assembly module TamB